MYYSILLFVVFALGINAPEAVLENESLNFIVTFELDGISDIDVNVTLAFMEDTDGTLYSYNYPLAFCMQ